MTGRYLYDLYSEDYVDYFTTDEEIEKEFEEQERMLQESRAIWSGVVDLPSETSPNTSPSAPTLDASTALSLPVPALSIFGTPSLPAASAQVAFGVTVGPRYDAPAHRPVVRPYVYGYAAPAYPSYGYAYNAPGYWEHRRYEDWRAHQYWEHRDWNRGYDRGGYWRR